MVVLRRAAQVVGRRQVWKINISSNAKTNASKLAIPSLVVVGWASNTECASFSNFKSTRSRSTGTMKERRARMEVR